MRFFLRFQWARVREELGWLIGDVMCLLLILVTLPVVPVLVAFDRARQRRIDDEYE